MQAIPLNVIDGHLVQGADLLAGPGAACQVLITAPCPDIGIGHRSLDIHVEAGGSGFGDGIDVTLDVLDLVTVEHAHLEGGVLGKGHRRRSGNLGAGCGGLAAVDGIDERCTACTGSHVEAHTAHIVAGGLADHGIAQDAAILADMFPVNLVADVQVIAFAALHQFVAIGSSVIHGTAQLQVQVAARALGLKDITAIALTLGEDVALVMDTGSTTCLDAVVDLIFIDQIVLVENTRSAGHCQDEGVGGHDVGLEAVVVGVLARVVVVDKGHRVTLILLVGSQALVVEGAPVTTGKRALHRVLKSKVKHGGLDAVVLLGLVQPPAQGLDIAVPVLAHREGGLASLVVQAHIVASITLAHVVTETVIAQFVNQVLLVGLDILLYIGAGVVQVTAAVKVLALVVGTCYGIALCDTLVGLADVGRRP